VKGGKKKKGVIGLFSHWLCLPPQKKNYEWNQTGCLEFPLRVKTNNRIAIALGSPSIFRQVTKRKKLSKSCTIKREKFKVILMSFCITFHASQF
jgi:hypothetical protein